MKTLPLRLVARTGPVLPLLVGIALALAAGVPAARAASAPPDFMTYQGFLVDGNGNALATNLPANYPVIFRIYAAATGGARLWSEQQIVTVDKGSFSVVLGEGTEVGGEAKPPLSSVFTGSTASERYMSISVTIGGSTPEILPRLRLLASPYSFLATSAANLVQPNGSNAITYANNRVEVAGNLITSGRVGIGTTVTPVAPLEVASGGVAVTGASSPYGGRGLYLEGQATLGALFAFNYNTAQPMPLVLNGPGGNVGIGTLSPNAPLSFGNSLGNTKLALWDGGVGSSFGLGIQASQFRFHVNNPADRFTFLNGPVGTELMTIQGSGNVGIGTTTPGRRFHVNGADTVMGRFDSSSTIGTWLSLGNSSVGGRYWQLISSGSGNGEGAGKLLIGSGASDGSTSIRLTVQDNGSVGIGTVSPAFRLHVQDPGAQTGRLHVGGTSANGDPKIISFGDGDLVHVGEVGGDDTLELKGSRVSVLGNVGLGIANPSDQLHLRGGRLRIDDGGSEFIQMYRSANGLIITGNGMGNAGGTGIGTVQWDGDGNWDSLSDRRLKKDITDAEPVLDRLMQLPVRRYRWKDGPADAPDKFGVIAQEVQPLFPESVGSLTRPDAREESLTVKYATFGLIAVKALQELKTEKDAERVAFQREIGELKKEVDRLKGRLAETEQVNTLQRELDGLKQIVQQLAATRKEPKTAAAKTGDAIPAAGASLRSIMPATETMAAR